MFIHRTIADSIKSELAHAHSKIVVIYGARQVGKTTLVEDLLKGFDKKILKANGDRLDSCAALSSCDLPRLQAFVNGYDILFVDEAQRIPEIGINLKILYDNVKDLKIIVTGSSSLDLSSSIKEAVTGRKIQHTLYPISFLELEEKYDRHELEQAAKERMIFGGYPEVFNIKKRNDKIKYISAISEDYLYKDVLELENIRYHHKLRALVRLLAFQIGFEVSLSELAMRIGLRRDTVARYIDLLEQSFVLFSLQGFSRNLRKEANKKRKIYFYDLGIRNAVINNFNDLDHRNDLGPLWENFLIAERIKRNAYKGHLCANYFWRTYTGAELDYVEDHGGKLYGYEFKWNKTAKVPLSWKEDYQGEFECFNRENFLKFIL